VQKYKFAGEQERSGRLGRHHTYLDVMRIALTNLKHGEKRYLIDLIERAKLFFAGI
jgi:hypothetical protein